MLRSPLLTILHFCLTFFVIALPLFMVKANSTTVDTSPSAIRTAIRQAIYQEPGSVRFRDPLAKGSIVSSSLARILVITLDTRNVEVCEIFSQSLRKLKSFKNTEPINEICSLSVSTTPIVRIFVLHSSSADEFYNYIDISSLNDREKDLALIANGSFKQTGFMGLLWAIPESLRVWEQSHSNIVTDPLQNYTGQPISDDSYYTLAKYRSSSILTSLDSSAVVSTFFWDYGLAEFSRTPTIPDLISTTALSPLIESYLHQAEENFRQNNTKSEDSKLASFAIINAHSDLSGKNTSEDTIVRTRASSQSSTTLFIRKHRPNPWSLDGSNTIGVEFKFKFHGH